MGFLGLEWCDFPFRCLPIYRHLKEKTKRNNCSLRVARKPAQNMAENWHQKEKKNEKRGGFSPCGRQSHMGMDPNKSPPPDPCQNGRRKTHKPLAGFHASEHRTKLHLLLWNDFCHHVSCILVCVNLLQLESFLFCSITNPVISDFNMFCSRVICGILAQVYCTLTVAIYHILILLHTQFFEECLYPY